MPHAPASSAAEHHLDTYRAKRDFVRTGEPSGFVRRSETGQSFVVQKHDARRLHYDFRLEWDGVLLSWAVPKGPSLVPGDKRLAVQTEDHPIDYRDFEGVIPEGQYGAGPVIVWDRGTWTPIGDPREGLRKGRLDFELEGEKLHGRFLLVRTKGDAKKPAWLLIKRDDAHAKATRGKPIVDQHPESILTGRTIDDVLAGVPPSTPDEPASRPTDRRNAKLPPFGSIQPQLATLVGSVPGSGPWVYEIKYDGYRALSWLDAGKVQIASRRGLDWTASYAGIADALARVRARNAIFDGEIAYVREDGRSDFQKLQNALGRGDPRELSRLVYFIFDLLHFDGLDLRDEPLSVRKDLLKTILAGEGPPLAMSGHLENGEAFLREACKLDLEGIIGKRTDRPYRSGRSTDWIKIKCHKRQGLVVVGFTAPKGRRTGIGALLLGLPKSDHGRDAKLLRYAGKVGTGFSEATLADLAARLSKLVVAEPSVEAPPRMRGVTWVKPVLVAEVRFTEWTKDGVLRHPSFEGLRSDKPARDVYRAVPEPPPAIPTRSAREGTRPRVNGILISHPERVIDAEAGITKLDLARYAGEIAPTMLPYVAKRPLMLLRCPEGRPATLFRQTARRGKASSRCFVQKHGGQGLASDTLNSIQIEGEEALYVTTTDQLVTLAQHNAVELHGWGCTVPRWDRPDMIVLDLDPDEALPFATVVSGAQSLRAALETLGLTSWVKTTGGKGLHVVVPIARRYDWPTVRRVSERIAVLMARAAPDRFVAVMSKKARVGKIFIDYLRNARGATAILPYSARARPGLPVALPIPWKDLPGLDPREFTIATVPGIVAQRRVDPWSSLRSARQILPRPLLDAATDD